MTATAAVWVQLGGKAFDSFASAADFVTTNGTPVVGDHYFDTTLNQMRVYDGTQWLDVQSITNNWVATSDPTVSQDETQGFSLGSFYFNTTLSKLFVAVDVTTGAAVWYELGAGGLKVFADVAAFEADKGTTSALGDSYIDSTDGVIKFHDGTLFRSVESKKNDFTATTNPTANDDDTLGYQIGSKWVNTSTDTLYICTNAGTGAAVWKAVGASLIGQKETPSGAVDGINVDFNVSQLPMDGTLIVMRDGLVVPSIEYSFTNPTVTFNSAPRVAQKIEVFYLTTGVASATVLDLNNYVVHYHDLTSTDMTNGYITLPSSPAVPSMVICDVVAGVPQRYAVDFVITNNNRLNWNGLRLQTQMSVGSELRIMYYI